MIEGNHFVLRDYEKLADDFKFNHVTSLIPENGLKYVNNGKQIRIYTPFLVYLFHYKNQIMVWDTDNQIEVEFDFGRFWKVFVESFNEGQKYFLENYSKTDLNDLQYLYSHKECQMGFGGFGWNFIKYDKNIHPIIISENTIQKYGYHTGLVFELEQLIEKHPIIFKDFYKSETNLNETISDKPTKKEKQMKSDESITLNDVIKNSNALEKVYDLLIEKSLIDMETKIYKDEKGGIKRLFVAILKTFYVKNYYSRKLKNKEIKDICKNSFGLEVGIDTIKSTKASSLDTTFISIPPFK